MSARSTLVGALAALTLCVGCADEPADPSTPAADAAGATTAPAPPPKKGLCYALSPGDVVEPTNDSVPVPCRKHTAITFHVGRLRPVVGSHLLAVDSDYAQSESARRCGKRLARYVGGSTDDLRLSRFEAVWFGPSLAQADLGANWFRCDLVLVAAPGELGTLPRKARGVLDRRGALDRFGTCGTAAPAASGFERVVCSREHTWRAREVITVRRGAHYLGKAAGRDASERCRDVAAATAPDPLRLAWSFEWPTRDQWQQGRRYGLCWVPDRE